MNKTKLEVGVFNQQIDYGIIIGIKVRSIPTKVKHCECKMMMTGAVLMGGDSCLRRNTHFVKNLRESTTLGRAMHQSLIK